MRVAVSGTHCCGKSTLIDEFLVAHPDFAHEPEPYVALQDDYGETFAAQPSADDFYRQLEFNVERLHRYDRGARVIYERSPADFLAYMLALDDLQREDSSQLIERSMAVIKEAIRLLDLIVFLPLVDGEREVISDSEDPELRNAVNSRLVSILSDDEYDLFATNRPVILEARGSTAGRLRILENALGMGRGLAEKR